MLNFSSRYHDDVESGGARPSCFYQVCFRRTAQTVNLIACNGIYSRYDIWPSFYFAKDYCIFTLCNYIYFGPPCVSARYISRFYYSVSANTQIHACDKFCK